MCGDVAGHKKDGLMAKIILPLPPWGREVFSIEQLSGASTFLARILPFRPSETTAQTALRVMAVLRHCGLLPGDWA
jgi:hypothetical protein